MPFRLDRPADESDPTEPRLEPPPDEWDEVPPPERPTDEPEYDNVVPFRRERESL